MPETDHSGIDSDPEHVSRDDSQELGREEDERRSEAERVFVARTEAEIGRAEEALQGVPAVEIEMQQLPLQGTKARDRVDTDQSDPQQRADYETIAETLGQMRRLMEQTHKEVKGPAVGPFRIKWALVAFGILGGLSTILHLIFALKSGNLAARAMAARGAAFPAQADEPQDVTSLRSKWLGNSERDFWNTYASFAETYKPRPFLEQLYFTQQTLDLANTLCPANDWTWNSPGDKLRYIDDVASTIRQSGISAAYRALATLTYGQPVVVLPRPIAADVMSLALTQWWQKS